MQYYSTYRTTLDHKRGCKILHRASWILHSRLQIFDPRSVSRILDTGSSRQDAKSKTSLLEHILLGLLVRTSSLPRQAPSKKGPSCIHIGSLVLPMQMFSTKNTNSAHRVAKVSFYESLRKGSRSTSTKSITQKAANKTFHYKPETI